MEVKQESVLDPEVIARINSYDASNELKDDFRKFLSISNIQEQMSNLKYIEKKISKYFGKTCRNIGL